MNGKVVELAQMHGLRADTNRTLTRLIRARERGAAPNANRREEER